MGYNAVSRKRILQLLHSLNTGGAEILADRFGRNFADQYDIIFACLDDVGEIGERLLEDGFQVVELRRGTGIDFGCMRRLKQLVRDESIDLIHAHQYTPFFYAMASQMVGNRKPILFTEHGRFLPDHPSTKRITFNRLMLRAKDRLVAVGKDVKRALIENEGLPANRIDVIYNGVPTGRFEKEISEEARQGIRSSLGIPPDAAVVVQVARLDYLKDHVTAVRAIAQATQQANMHLIIVGDGPEREKIEQEINDYEIGDRVHMIGLRKDIPEILAASDILLLTSISEGIPLTLIEGMAAGLPIVSTDVGGVSEVVTNQVHALLSPSQDAAQIASHLVQLTHDCKLRHQLGSAGRKVARERFSESVMQHHYETLVSCMLNQTP